MPSLLFRRLASSSASCRSSMSRTLASASALARALRSSSVSVRRTTPEALRGAAGGAGERGCFCRRGGRCLGDDRLRRMRLRRGAIAADAALATLFNHDLLGTAVAEALLHGARLDARLERQGLVRDTQFPVARRFINHSAVLILLRRACPHRRYRRILGRMAGRLVVVRHPVSDQEL